MGEIGGLPDQRLGEPILGVVFGIDQLVPAERTPNGFERVGPRALIDR